jgi:hypothetical protein
LAIALASLLSRMREQRIRDSRVCHGASSFIIILGRHSLGET